MKIYFIRHGQTDWNKQGKMQGSTDIPLNETGLSQAQDIALSLSRAGVQFEKIFSSPLSRALKTAQIINEKQEAPLEVFAELKEFYFGQWEGQYSQDLKDQDLDGFNSWLENAFLVAPPEGESLIEMQDRLKAFLDQSSLLKLNSDVAVVAHQGTLLALKSLLTGERSTEVLLSYKQANNEYDIMDMETLELTRLAI